MRQTIHRRRFLQSTGTGLLAAGTLLQSAQAKSPARMPQAKRLGWELCCQLYTFRHTGLYEALPKIAALGFTAIEPCFFLKLTQDDPQRKTNHSLSAKDRAELKTRLADHGIRMAHYYVNLGTDEEAGRKEFEFAKAMGVETLISEPPAEAFDTVEKLCDEYEINLAVHNHPKSPKSKYWNPESVLAVCKGRGKRIGACCDTGHWVRSALNPVECLKQMEGRIVSLHLKDVPEWGVPKARDVPLGTGKADYGAVLEEIHRQGFQGVMAVEYEHQSDKLEEELAQCLAFVEKTAASL